jgi:hypothetical protein
MHNFIDRTWTAGRWRGFAIRLILCCTAGAITASMALATENGASVYPAGVETVMPGMAPAPGQTLFLTFNDYYTANGLANSQGQNAVPGFQLQVEAFAVKIVHNWGVHLLGGTLVSAAAQPFLYENLAAPFGAQAKTGFANPDIQVGAIAYAKGDWHWWYGFDMYTPGFAYTKTDLINIGQHNFAYTPSAAFTFLPKHGRLEISSKYQYIINGTDSATNYKSGAEFVGEYDGMVKVTRKLSIGGNGFFYRQMTNDVQNGLVVGDGNRGRDFAFGPEVKYHLGKCALIAKYEKDMLVENRPIGNSFWLQFGVPLGHGHE